MKSFTAVAVIAFTSVLSFNAMAESVVKDSIVLNKSVNQGNTTIADGYDNLASTGSINVKDSTVEKSTVLNESTNQGNSTIAIGEGNTVTTGSITFE